MQTMKGTTHLRPFPDLPVVSVVGDGSFCFSGRQFAAAAAMLLFVSGTPLRAQTVAALPQGDGRDLIAMSRRPQPWHPEPNRMGFSPPDFDVDFAP